MRSQRLDIQQEQVYDIVYRIRQNVPSWHSAPMALPGTLSGSRHNLTFSPPALSPRWCTVPRCIPIPGYTHGTEALKDACVCPLLENRRTRAACFSDNEKDVLQVSHSRIAF